jgi:hypothetical protein
MKNFIILLLWFLMSLPVYCQWNQSTPTTSETISRNGNIELGSVPANPSSKLAIARSGDTGNTLLLAAPLIGNVTSHVHWGGTGDWFIRSASTSGNVIIQDTGGKVGVGTSTPRGAFDVGGSGDIYLAGSVNTGTTQSIYLPGHIYISPYNATSTSYLQARRADNSGSTALHIRTWNAGQITEAMQIESNGRVGIGVFNPEATLHAHSEIKTSHPGQTNINLRMQAVGIPAIRFTRWTGNGDDYHTAFVGQIWDAQVGCYSLALGATAEFNGNQDNVVPTIYMPTNGNVGIGTNNPDAKLAVKGHIHTQEVRVDLTGAVAPDYVFEKEYELLPLSELETYINQNKHLPEVPSAKEMEKEGLNLKEMNLLLLKKVEELTLHLIEMKKEINELKNKQ